MPAEKEAKELLAEEKKYLSRFQNLLLQTPVAIAIFRGSNYIVEFANDKAVGVMVKDRSFIGKPLFEGMPELEHPLKEIFDKATQTGIPFQANEMELSLFRNGKTETGWFNLNYQPILDDDNTNSGILASVHEVTEQVLSRKKTEDSEKRYNMMLMKSPFGFAVFKGKNMVITLANDTIKEIWGKGKDVEGKPLFDVLPELKDTAYPGLLDDVYMTGVPFQGNEILASFLRNGKIEDSYFNLVYQPYLEADETISGVTVVAHEVTAQVILKKALDAKHEAEQKALKLVEETNKRYYSMLMDSPFAFCVMKGKDMVITLANSLIKEFWGKGTDVEGKTLLQLLPELQDQPFPEMIEKVYMTGIPLYANEILGKITYNGQLKHKYFNVVFQPYYEADNSISGVTQIAYDVTEMILARKKIEESDKRYNMMLMHSPFTFVVLKGKDLVVDLANDRIKAVWGKGNDVEGKCLLEIMPELNNTTFPALMDEVIATGIPYHGREVQSPHNVHGHAREEFFNFVFQPYWEADETISGITIIGYDVTEQVIAKRKIEESEQRFRLLVMQAPVAICVLRGEDFIIETMNQEMANLLDRKIEDSIHKPLFDVIAEVKGQIYKELLDTVYLTGKRFVAQELLLTIKRNNKLEDVFVKFVYEPLLEADGTISGVMVLADEITDQVLARKKIEESDKRYNMMLMHSPFTFAVLKGKDLVIALANNQIKEVWGRGNDIEGKSLLEIMPELKDSPFPALLDEVMQTGIPFFGKEVQSPKNMHGHIKEEYFFNFVFQPYLEADETISGITIIGNEVTEQVLAKRKIEISEKRFRLLTNAMPQKIANADADGNIIFFNQQWLEDTGLTFEELRDWGWEKSMHPDDLDLTVNTWKHSVATGDVFDMECRIQNKEGEYRWHLSRAVPVKDEKGKIIMWVGSNTDIQEQKEQKEKLQLAVAARTLELSEANEELKKINKELEAFTYVSSHDLQEPLRKIRTMAGRILEKENQNLSDSGKKYFHLMQNAAERMQTLIQDLLAFSRLSVADRKFESTNLSIIIEDVKKEFKEAIAEKNATVEVKEICVVKIIPFQFRQLMYNLISNALKFSNPNIPPHIIIESQNIPFSKLNIKNLPPKKEYCHITISDNGIGFEKEFAEKIFEVFQKLHGKDEYAGTGIGLAIVKKIIENHNGMITATSELKKGTIFNIYIPA